VTVDMRLLLTSFLHPRIGDFRGETVAYIPGAARTLGDTPFNRAERRSVAVLGRNSSTFRSPRHRRDRREDAQSGWRRLRRQHASTPRYV